VSDVYVCMIVSVFVMLYMVVVILLVVVMFLKVCHFFDRLWYSMCVCARVVDVRRCS
jgi:hypothetical protein